MYIFLLLYPSVSFTVDASHLSRLILFWIVWPLLYILYIFFVFCLVGFFSVEAKDLPTIVHSPFLHSLQSFLMLLQNFLGFPRLEASFTSSWFLFFHSQLDAFSSNYYMWVQDVFSNKSLYYFQDSSTFSGPPVYLEWAGPQQKIQ